MTNIRGATIFGPHDTESRFFEHLLQRLGCEITPLTWDVALGSPHRGGAYSRIRLMGRPVLSLLMN